MKHYSWLISLILFSALLVGCGAASTAETDGGNEAGDSSTALTSVDVCYSSPSGTQSVAPYAFEKGLFEKHGLEVNLTYINSGSKAATALVAGDVDFCQIAGAAVVNAAVAGEDVAIIGGLFNTYVYSLMVVPDIELVEDLRGEALAISRAGSASDAAIRAALKGLGLTPDEDVAIMAVGGQGERLAAMETGSVVGTVVSVPQTVEAKEQGYRELLDMSKLGTPYQHTAIATTHSYIEANRETTLNFMKAIAEAIALMKQDRDGAIEVMGQYLLLDVEEDAPSLNEAYDVLIQNYLPQVPSPTVEGVQTLLDGLVAENPAAAETDPAVAVDLSIVEELESGGFIDGLYE